ncbi:MAG: flagellar hook-associated protein FlgL [Succinivibrionaceae bacterium]
MRITTNMSFNRSISYLQTTNSKIDKLSQQYNTGEKFTTAGEDPTGMGNKLRLETEISTYTQYSINAGLAADSLGLEETALTSIYSNLQSVLSELQTAVNGTYDKDNLEAIATSLEESQALIYDLMNTQTANGEYIFSGNQSSIQTIQKEANGYYVCNIDAGFRQIKISPSVQVRTSDSGLTLFQQSETSRNVIVSDADKNNVSVKYKDVESFNSFYNDKYTKSGTNELIIEYQEDGNNPGNGSYTVKFGNETIQKGVIKEGDTIAFNGLEINLKKGVNQVTLKFDEPKNDNVLNTMQKAIDALRDPNMNSDELAKVLSQVQVDVSSANEKINISLGHVGARLSNIDKVIESNDSLKTIKQEAKANISEVDIYETTAELLKQQNALSVAQQTFSLVNGSTLFDYIK